MRRCCASSSPPRCSAASPPRSARPTRSSGPRSSARQLVGLGVLRYIVRVEPLASADTDAVVAAVAPTIQRYLTGDLADPR